MNPAETPTPLTDEHLKRITIENEDSSAEIHVKIDGSAYEGELATADFARDLESRLAEATKERDEALRKLAACREALEAMVWSSELLQNHKGAFDRDAAVPKWAELTVATNKAKQALADTADGETEGGAQ